MISLEWGCHTMTRVFAFKKTQMILVAKTIDLMGHYTNSGKLLSCAKVYHFWSNIQMVLLFIFPELIRATI